MKIKKNLYHFLPFISLWSIAIFFWYPVLSFWFFGSWEPGWLLRSCIDYHFTPLCLMKSHGFLSMVNYLLYGWNPIGWYVNALLLQIVAVTLLYILSNKLIANRFIAWIIAVIYVTNIAYNDILTWGSFQGVYIFVFDIFLCAGLLFLFFLKKRKKHWYALTILATVFGLFVRETALLIPVFLFLLFLLQTNKIRKEDLVRLVLPFFILACLYLLFRKWYGGAPSDYIDDMVQLRIALLHRQQYFEYATRVIFTYGKLTLSQIIPYPLLNFLRMIVESTLRASYIHYYFFPFLGLLYTTTQTVILITFKTKKKIKKMLQFSFFLTLISLLFFATSLPMTDAILEEDYGWDANRYRLFAFIGTIIFWTVIGWQFYKNLKKHKTITQVFLFSILGLVICVNFLLLRNIQKSMYLTVFKPQEDFYKQFISYFPTLPKNYIFYTFPYATPLNDYINQWNYIKKRFYPNLVVDRNDWFEGQVQMLLPKIQTHKINIANTFFLDYDSVKGLENKTQEVRYLLLHQPLYHYEINAFVTKQNPFSMRLNPSLFVEIPYIYQIHLTYLPSGENTVLSDKEKLLREYANDRESYLKTASITTCRTAPFGSEDPAAHLLPNHLIDGNFGPRSLWVAATSCKPAWIIVDLHQIESIEGVAFQGASQTDMPSIYTISVSNDRIHWQVVLERKNNTSLSRIDILPHAISARYVRYAINQTYQGGQPTLDEIEVINKNVMQLKSYYKDDFVKLVKDSYAVSDGYFVFHWTTSPNNVSLTNDEETEIYIPLTTDGVEHIYTVSPNENEMYSTAGQFLKRKITDVSIGYSGLPVSIYISSIDIIPKFPIEK